MNVARKAERCFVYVKFATTRLELIEGSVARDAPALPEAAE
jgi:hypothetical protein